MTEFVDHNTLQVKLPGFLTKCKGLGIETHIALSNLAGRWIKTNIGIRERALRVAPLTVPLRLEGHGVDVVVWVAIRRVRPLHTQLPSQGSTPNVGAETNLLSHGGGVRGDSEQPLPG